MALPQTLKAIAITAKSGSTCTANIGGIEATIQVARDLTVATGDALIVVRSGATFTAVARAGTAAPAAIDPPPPAPPPIVTAAGSLVVPPVFTGTWLNGAWFDSIGVRQGSYSGGNATGAAFYGDLPVALDGATVSGASLRVRREAGGNNAYRESTLQLIGEDVRPAGAPTLIDDVPGPVLRRGETDDAFEIPQAWAQDIADGTAGGLGLFDTDGSPVIVFATTGLWSPAFTLTVRWNRS